jgi:hypothetical protein
MEPTIKKEATMLKNRLLKYLFLFLFGMSISACAQLGLQSKKEAPEPGPIPDCKKNYAKEGNFISGRTYKTWVKYDNIDYRKGFDIAVMALKARGHRVIHTDRDMGTINAEMTFGSEAPKTHPVEVNLVKEKTSLTIHLISKSAIGSSGTETFCSFYAEFEKGIKRAWSPPSPKQAGAPPKKPPETAKESTPSAPPPPAATPKPPPSSALSTPSSPKPLLTRAEVTWGSANVREGPGMNYKVVRKVNKGTPLGILEEKKGWLRVRLDDGVEAWISKSATSEGVKTSPASPPPSSPTPSPAPESSKPKSPM